MEHWREVPELEGYEASDLGQLRRAGKVLRLHWTGRGASLRLAPAAVRPAPSPFIAPAYRRTDRTAVSAARLICLAWHGYPPHEHYRVGHEDDDPRNLKFENLYWYMPVQSWPGGPWRKERIG